MWGYIPTHFSENYSDLLQITVFFQYSFAFLRDGIHDRLGITFTAHDVAVHIAVDDFQEQTVFGDVPEIFTKPINSEKALL